jgi:hypothetical protein
MSSPQAIATRENRTDMDPIRTRLVRLGEDEGAMVGIWFFGDERVLTIERPWKLNEPFVSCIPTGFYIMEPITSDAHGDTWALVGKTVAQQKTPNIERWACRPHIANTMNEVVGCQGVGMEMGTLEGAVAVLKSGEAMGLMRQTLGRRRHYVTITGPDKDSEEENRP